VPEGHRMRREALGQSARERARRLADEVR
jgi:hypothetical protein